VLEEAEENLRIKGIINSNAIARDNTEWRRVLLKVNVHSRFWCLERRITEEKEMSEFSTLVKMKETGLRQSDS
jgi:hypothetical protein